MKIAMTIIIERQRARLYTQKATKIAKLFYKQKTRHFSKSKTVSVTFLYTKINTLDVKGFYENDEVGIYIQKAWHFALCDVFIYKKLDTSQKARQFAIRFYIQKSGTFALRNFSLNFWHLRRGGGIYSFKKKVLCVTFLYWKKMHFSLRCYIKSLTLCVTL